jgi:hypothetical protein
MFHAVNGDSAGSGKVSTSAIPTPMPDTTSGNKGDRGYSDMTEARVFLIGTPHGERNAR